MNHSEERQGSRGSHTHCDAVQIGVVREAVIFVQHLLAYKKGSTDRIAEILVVERCGCQSGIQVIHSWNNRGDVAVSIREERGGILQNLVIDMVRGRGQCVGR